MWRSKYLELFTIRILFAIQCVSSPVFGVAAVRSEKLPDVQQTPNELTSNDISSFLRWAWLSPGGQTALHVTQETYSSAHEFLNRAVHTASACPVITTCDVTTPANRNCLFTRAPLHIHTLSRVDQLPQLQDLISSSVYANSNLLFMLVFQNSSVSHADFLVEWNMWRKNLLRLGISTNLQVFATQETYEEKYFQRNRVIKTNVSLRNIHASDDSLLNFSQHTSAIVYILQVKFLPRKALEISKHSTSEISMKFFRKRANRSMAWDGYDFLSWNLFENWIGFPLNRAYSRPTVAVWNHDAIEHIANKTAEFAFNYHYFTYQRYKFLDYTASLTQFPLCIIVQKAPNIPFSLLLLRPYSLDTWMCMIVSLVAGSVGLCIVRRHGVSSTRSVHRSTSVSSGESTSSNDCFGSVKSNDRFQKKISFMEFFRRDHRVRTKDNSTPNCSAKSLSAIIQKRSVQTISLKRMRNSGVHLASSESFFSDSNSLTRGCRDESLVMASAKHQRYQIEPVEASVTLSAPTIRLPSLHAELPTKQMYSSPTPVTSTQHFVYSATSVLKAFGRAVFDTMQISLTGACSHAATSSSQRLSHFALLLAALTLGNAYTGQLLGFLAAPPRYRDAETLSDAASIVRRLQMPVLIPGVFDIPDGPNSLQILNNKIVLSPRADMDAILRHIVDYGQDAYVLPDIDYYVYSRMKEMTVHDKEMLHLVPECALTPGHVAFLVKKKSPFFNVLNDFVLRIVGAGLYDYWVHAQRNHMTMEGQLIPEHASKKEPEKLRVQQVTGPLILLALGLGVASLCFLVEMLRKFKFH